MTFRELLRSKAVVSADGGMGTQLQAMGLQPGEIPELWNLRHPDRVRQVHADYFAAGADYVMANTFGANPAKYEGDAPLKDVIAAGIGLAREAATAAGADRFVALDVGPTGRLLKPSGDFEFDAAYDAFAETVRLGAAAGADLVVLETLNDTYELKAALLAAKENADLPIVATVALDADGKLLTGGTVECVAALFNALKPDVCGFNCGLGPDLLLPHVRRLAELTDIPILVKANAGLPRVVDGCTIFDVGPDAFAADLAACVEAGASLVGGCCGTTPQHLAAVNARPLCPGRVPRASRTVVSSYSRCVDLPLDDSLIIGERINPTGKKKLREAYKAGDTGYILREAIAQMEAGAHILDVNAGVPGIDEPSVLDATVQAIQGVTDLPLQIDTSDPVAMERALRHYNGVPLLNSVNGKDEVMDAVFPLVARYGGVVVGLTLDETGIPSTAEGRVAIARKILAKGASYGLTSDDFVIDVLCLAVSADANSVNVILESMRRVRAELGCRTVLGVSNVSFGLPARPLLNGVFYTLALQAGLTTAIINPLSADMMTAYHAWRALTGRDRNCETWIAIAPTGTDPLKDSSSGRGSAGVTEVVANRRIEESKNREIKITGKITGTVPQITGTVPQTGRASLRLAETTASLNSAIRHGLKADAAATALAALATGTDPVRIIDGEIVPALEQVGRGFETGKVFLPQLLMAAEAAASAFEVIRRELAKTGTATEPKGPILIATVKGDIHDIGKNIVRALLENYGFRVIDLGRDVPPERIVEAAVREKCRLVGLSALMTTTVGAMAETIRLLKEADPSIRTFVGGAVLTADYAEQIQATWYAKDAMASVRVAEAFFA